MQHLQQESQIQQYLLDVDNILELFHEIYMQRTLHCWKHTNNTEQNKCNWELSWVNEIAHYSYKAKTIKKMTGSGISRRFNIVMHWLSRCGHISPSQAYAHSSTFMFMLI